MFHPQIAPLANAKELVEFVDPACVSEAHREVWRRLHSGHGGHETVYASPAFFDALIETQTAEGLMLALHPAALALAVLRLHNQLLDPHGLAGYVLRWNMRMWALSGSEPLLNQAATADSLADFLCALSTMPGRHDAFELQSVGVGSLPWKAVTESERVRETFFVYMPNGVRSCHLTPLPESAEAYLAQFPRKKRYNLSRQLRQIGEHQGGPVTLDCLDDEASVDTLLDALARLHCPVSVLLERAEYVALARRNLLMNFVASAGGRPFAVILGIPSGATYRISRVLFDHGLEQFSPGTSALHLLNEALIADRRFREIDFGFGEPMRSFSSSNRVVQRARILLLRKTLGNGLILMAHRAIARTERLGARAVAFLYRRPPA